MKRTTRNVLMGYGVFCAVNWAATYFTARSGSPLLFGSAGLLSLNETLRPWNLLARVIDPIAFAEKQSRAAAPPAASSLPLGPDQLGLTDQAINSSNWN